MGEDLERHRQNNSKPEHLVHSAPAVIPSASGRVSLLIPFIVMANVAMFIISMYINNCPQNAANVDCFARHLGRFSFQPVHENPLLGPSSHTLQKVGALDINKVVHSHQGWRLITCIWLHAGLIHILFNMLSLLFIGIKLEQEFGFWKIGILYTVSGSGGSLLSALFLRNTISVGASGALFGLLGAMLSELITNWSLYLNKCAALATLIVVVVINLAVGIFPHVDNFAHIGGFVSGFLAGFVLLVQPQAGWSGEGNVQHGYDNKMPMKRKHKVYQYILLVGSLVVLIAGFTVALVLVLRGVDGNKKCSWCHYLSCVPTSKWKCNSVGSEYCRTISSGTNVQLVCLSNNKTLASANQSSSVVEDLCAQLCS